jgi:hypothetical protein
LRAVSLALGACHRLYVDGSVTMARLAQDFTSKPPIEKDEMRLSILNGIRATAGGAVRAITIRNRLLAACVLVGSNLITAGAMWWWRPGVSVVQRLLVSTCRSTSVERSTACLRHRSPRLLINQR